MQFISHTYDWPVELLQRALAEPPAAAERVGVLCELGVAECLTKPADAAAHLDEARRTAADPGQKAGASLALVRALAMAERMEDAYQVARDACSWIERPSMTATLIDNALLMMAALSGHAGVHADLIATLDRADDHASPMAFAVHGQLATMDIMANRPRARVLERIRRAMGGDGSVLDPITTMPMCVAAIWADDSTRADDYLSRAITMSADAGSAQTFRLYSAIRAYLYWRTGDLRAAQADLAQAVGVDDLPLGQLVPRLVTSILLTMDLGEASAAEAVIGSLSIPAEVSRQPNVALVRLYHGMAQLANRRPGEAVVTLENAGRDFADSGFVSPAALEWRSQLARAKFALGDHAAARTLIDEELSLAQAGGYGRAEGGAARAGHDQQGSGRDRGAGRRCRRPRKNTVPAGARQGASRPRRGAATRKPTARRPRAPRQGPGHRSPLPRHRAGGVHDCRAARSRRPATAPSELGP